MNSTDMRPVELLLEAIADELLVARMDRESGTGIAARWTEEDRAAAVQRIEKNRARFDKYPDV